MIIVASQSIARQRLLKQAGVPYRALTPDLDERAFKQKHPNTKANELAQLLADAKALSLSAHNPEHLVIGSDQTLDLKGTLLSKPASLQTARQQLQSLRNESHHLYSAVTVAKNGFVIFRHTDTTTLTVRNFSDEWLDDYLIKAGSDVLHSVGGYQFESLGINLFSDVQGDSFTIQGLPLLPLLGFLRDIGEIPT